MATEQPRLTDMKCRDCLHCVLTGWWDRSKICDVSGFPVDQDAGVCISFMPKKNATR